MFVETARVRGSGRLGLGVALASMLLACAPARSTSYLLPRLQGTFDLAGPRAPQIQYFRMETQYVFLGFDGKRVKSETYSVKLKGVPASLSGKGADEYTCGQFQLRFNDGPAVTIPSLAGWSYLLRASGMDEQGQVLGVPRAKFENLTDSRGAKLDQGVRYKVYNHFIDFHAFNDFFARPTRHGRGIQDLKAVGQKIVHSSAFSTPPVDLGSATKKGSFFRNGEVTLELKGVGVVDGAPCAVVSYDSGESTLRVIVPLGQGADVETVGGSEYKGDLFVDLETRWVRKITMDEFVVTETRLPGRPQMDAYVVRHLLGRLTSQAEFESK